MYAIVDIAGQQFKVEKDKKIFVHRLDGQEGSSVEFDKVLLIDNDKDVTVGSPVISGAMVTAKILGHLKGDKVIVFKKKRRKGYQKRNGHRQYLTQIVVEDIIETGAKPKVAEKKAAPAPKKETVKADSEKAAQTAKTKVAKEAPKASESKAVKEKPAEKAKEVKKASAVKEKAKPAAKKTASKPAAKKTAASKATAAKKSSPKSSSAGSRTSAKKKEE